MSNTSDMNSSIDDDLITDEEDKKCKRKDTPTFTHIPAKGKMLGQVKKEL